jgi:hypothetical protein
MEGPRERRGIVPRAIFAAVQAGGPQIPFPLKYLL